MPKCLYNDMITFSAGFDKTALMFYHRVGYKLVTFDR